MRYLITGATGLVGSWFAHRLHADGHDVIGLRRANSHTPAWLPSIQWAEGDVSDIHALRQAMAQADVVIHCAAVVSFAPAKASYMHQVNVEGTANVVNACLERQIPLCHLSSIAALGRDGRTTHLNETAKWEASRHNSRYALTKYLAEVEVWRGIAEGLPTVILNPSIILGRGDWTRSSSQLFGYAAKGRAFYPTGWLNYVDVRDVVDAGLLLLANKQYGQRFVLNGGTVPYRDFLIQAAKALGTSAPRYAIQPWMAGLAWRALWPLSLITGREPLITRETAHSAQMRLTYSSDKIKQQGFVFRPLEETISWVAKAR